MRTIIILIILLSGFGISQAVEKKNEDQKTINSKSAQADKTRTPTAPVVLNITGNTQNLKNTCNPANCDNEPEPSWWNKLWTDPVATFTGALFLATAALIVTGIVQWFETRSTARKELRAYVGITSGEIVRLNPNHIQGYVVIRNTGKTPAHKVTKSITIEIRDAAQPGSFTMPERSRGNWPIHPGAAWTFRQDVIEITDEVMADLINYKKSVFVWGKSEYVDIYDKPHSLEFRYRNLAKKMAWIVKEGGAQSLEIQGWELHPEEEGNKAT